ncbi:MAG: hypothetical protein U0Q15_03300 [Kineosporiaceae bacterium]
MSGAITQAWTEHVGAWAASHDARLVPAADVAEVDAVLAALPWAATRLDWSGLPHVVLVLGEQPPDVSGTALARCPHVVAYLAPGAPALVGARDAVLADLDEIYWRAPGLRYLVGADRDAAGGLVLDARAVGEYDGGERLTLSR